MTTHFRDDTSIEIVADTTDSVAAALETDPLTVDLAPTWNAITEKGDKLAAERRVLTRSLLRARSRVGVSDSIWDRMTAGLGRAVVDASNGRRDQVPYTRFFNKTTPSNAQTFGIDREVDQGRVWETELDRNPEEPLATTWAPKVKSATDGLASARDARNEAVKAFVPHQTAVLLFIDDVNRELDRLEGELRKRFAGSQERVSAFLSATRRSRTTRLVEEEPAPSEA